jgi:enoyl-CoA hydratase/carnithine racemase
VTLQRDGGIGIVTLRRPERLNAISAALLADLGAVLDVAVSDDSLAVLILCGDGRAFCAGNDLKELHTLTTDPSAAAAFVDALQAITRRLLRCDKIIIGAVQGYAVGGGFEWLLNCDLVIAADDLVAFFPEMALGQFVTGGVTYLLPRAVGSVLAMEWLLLGERQDASTLLRAGVVNRVVGASELLPTAMRLARSVLDHARASTIALKRTLQQSAERGLEAALVLEAEHTLSALAREDAQLRGLGVPVSR